MSFPARPAHLSQPATTLPRGIHLIMSPRPREQGWTSCPKQLATRIYRGLAAVCHSSSRLRWPTRAKWDTQAPTYGSRSLWTRCLIWGSPLARLLVICLGLCVACLMVQVQAPMRSLTSTIRGCGYAWLFVVDKGILPEWADSPG
jgi:hypothetical protein